VIRQHTINTAYPVGPVHCYTGELGGELVLFDTGPPTREAQNCLREQVDLSRLRHVVITHCHIDHYGLVSWLKKETDAILYFPYRDALKIARHEEHLGKVGELLLELGFDHKFLDSFRSSMSAGEVFPQHPGGFKVVEDDLPEHLGLEVVACPGHSQSDLVLVSSDWMVTGDVLLRGIFQAPLLDIDYETGERFRNYDAYCSTLVKLAALRGKQVLPGHRDSIVSIDDAILFYVSKLLGRTAEMKRFSDDDNVAHVVGQLFDGEQKHPFHCYLKASEIAFMRDFLRDPDRLRISLEQIGLFESVSEKFLHTVNVSTSTNPRN